MSRNLDVIALDFTIQMVNTNTFVAEGLAGIAGENYKDEYFDYLSSYAEDTHGRSLSETDFIALYFEGENKVSEGFQYRVRVKTKKEFSKIYFEKLLISQGVLKISYKIGSYNNIGSDKRKSSYKVIAGDIARYEKVSDKIGLSQPEIDNNYELYDIYLVSRMNALSESQDSRVLFNRNLIEVIDDVLNDHNMPINSYEKLSSYYNVEMSQPGDIFRSFSAEQLVKQDRRNFFLKAAFEYLSITDESFTDEPYIHSFKYSFILQKDETNLDFLKRRLSYEGVMFFCETRQTLLPYKDIRGRFAMAAGQSTIFATKPAYFEVINFLDKVFVDNSVLKTDDLGFEIDALETFVLALDLRSMDNLLGYKVKQEPYPMSNIYVEYPNRQINWYAGQDIYFSGIKKRKELVYKFVQHHLPWLYSESYPVCVKTGDLILKGSYLFDLTDNLGNYPADPDNSADGFVLRLDVVNRVMAAYNSQGLPYFSANTVNPKIDLFKVFNIFYANGSEKRFTYGLKEGARAPWYIPTSTEKTKLYGRRDECYANEVLAKSIVIEGTQVDYFPIPINKEFSETLYGTVANPRYDMDLLYDKTGAYDVNKTLVSSEQKESLRQNNFHYPVLHDLNRYEVRFEFNRKAFYINRNFRQSSSMPLPRTTNSVNRVSKDAFSGLNGGDTFIDIFTAQIGSGMDLPIRVGTRVIIGFIDNDMDRPIIIGCLNDVNKDTNYWKNPLGSVGVFYSDALSPTNELTYLASPAKISDGLKSFSSFEEFKDYFFKPSVSDVLALTGDTENSTTKIYKENIETLGSSSDNYYTSLKRLIDKNTDFVAKNLFNVLSTDKASTFDFLKVHKANYGASSMQGSTDVVSRMRDKYNYYLQNVNSLYRDIGVEGIYKKRNFNKENYTYELAIAEKPGSDSLQTNYAAYELVEDELQNSSLDKASQVAASFMIEDDSGLEVGEGSSYEGALITDFNKDALSATSLSSIQFFKAPSTLLESADVTGTLGNYINSGSLAGFSIGKTYTPNINNAAAYGKEGGLFFHNKLGQESINLVSQEYNSGLALGRNVMNGFEQNYLSETVKGVYNEEFYGGYQKIFITSKFFKENFLDTNIPKNQLYVEYGGRYIFNLALLGTPLSQLNSFVEDNQKLYFAKLVMRFIKNKLIEIGEDGFMAILSGIAGLIWKIVKFAFKSKFNKKQFAIPDENISEIPNLEQRFKYSQNSIPEELLTPEMKKSLSERKANFEQNKSSAFQYMGELGGDYLTLREYGHKQSVYDGKVKNYWYDSDARTYHYGGFVRIHKQNIEILGSVAMTKKALSMVYSSLLSNFSSDDYKPSDKRRHFIEDVTSLKIAGLYVPNAKYLDGEAEQGADKVPLSDELIEKPRGIGEDTASSVDKKRKVNKIFNRNFVLMSYKYSWNDQFVDGDASMGVGMISDYLRITNARFGGLKALMNYEKMGIFTHSEKKMSAAAYAPSGKFYKDNYNPFKVWGGEKNFKTETQLINTLRVFNVTFDSNNPLSKVNNIYDFRQKFAETEYIADDGTKDGVDLGYLLKSARMQTELSYNMFGFHEQVVRKKDGTYENDGKIILPFAHYTPELLDIVKVGQPYHIIFNGVEVRKVIWKDGANGKVEDSNIHMYFIHKYANISSRDDVPTAAPDSGKLGSALVDVYFLHGRNLAINTHNSQFLIAAALMSPEVRQEFNGMQVILKTLKNEYEIGGISSGKVQDILAILLEVWKVEKAPELDASGNPVEKTVAYYNLSNEKVIKDADSVVLYSGYDLLGVNKIGKSIKVEKDFSEFGRTYNPEHIIDLHNSETNKDNNIYFTASFSWMLNVYYARIYSLAGLFNTTLGDETRMLGGRTTRNVERLAKANELLELLQPFSEKLAKTNDAKQLSDKEVMSSYLLKPEEDIYTDIKGVHQQIMQSLDEAIQDYPMKVIESLLGVHADGLYKKVGSKAEELITKVKTPAGEKYLFSLKNLFSEEELDAFVNSLLVQYKDSSDFLKNLVAIDEEFVL